MARLKYLILFSLIFTAALMAKPVFAGAPSGSFWFQFFTQTQTGSDNTGDGGTGNPADYNYYYVGQSVNLRADVGIGAGHPSNGADLIVNYDKNITTASSLTSLSAYQYWTGSSVDNGTGKYTLSGYNDAGVYYSGQRQYNNITYTMVRPSAVNYGLTSTLLNIDFTLGVTTDSNIARDGTDYMDSKEDFNMLVWADTKQPYGLNPSPASGVTGVAVDSNYTFDVRDSKNGEGDNSGVGTGFSTSVVGRNIDIFDGSATTSYTGSASYGYSGIWQTLCSASVDPASPLSIPGDARNWKYNTNYTVAVSGFKDQASAAQNQLGDANGPNFMSTKTWTFTTESDTTAPTVQLRNPAAGATGVSASTNVYVEIVDKKSASVSGVGVNASTCSINVSSPSFPLTTYTSASPEVTVTPISYGYSFSINPSVDFAQNEIISVAVYNCQDLAGNTMTTDNYTFRTSDTAAPYISTTTPANDASAAATSHVLFTIKDDGVGVDLTKTVVYINGQYYTDDGTGGSINTIISKIPVKITFASSTNFTGSYSAVTGGYSFDIAPGASFTAGETVPVIIYSQDASGNIMERYVYAFSIQGASCVAGSTYCGTNATWDGAMCNGTAGSAFCGSNTSWSGSLCVGTGGGSSSGGGGGGTTIFAINSANAFVSQVNETSVLVTWYSSLPASGRVVWDTSAVGDLGSQPNYGYSQSTAETDNASIYHSVLITGLKAGNLYYFRPISQAAGYAELLGPELKMAPVFATTVSVNQSCVVNPTSKPAPSSAPAKNNNPPAPVIQQPTTPAVPSVPAVVPSSGTTQDINILNINSFDSQINLNGTATPNADLTIIVY